ncbi:hypothetical protein [Rufibacter ruber]|uniref:hypothetical protein n=1 Tax=Rufibacter ruber TaxID=1783499 RepID=UPI00128FD0DB|nr:hypothetical protein [Rufibacter ruber]
MERRPGETQLTFSCCYPLLFSYFWHSCHFTLTLLLPWLNKVASYTLAIGRCEPLIFLASSLLLLLPVKVVVACFWLDLQKNGSKTLAIGRNELHLIMNAFCVNSSSASQADKGGVRLLSFVEVI